MGKKISSCTCLSFRNSRKFKIGESWSRLIWTEITTGKCGEIMAQVV
jgi:hypothetical protein